MRATGIGHVGGSAFMAPTRTRLMTSDETTLPQHLRQGFEKLMRVLTEPDPYLDLVLRGHLLVEELLDNLIAAYMMRPDALANARLSFAQKTSLAQGLTPTASAAQIWSTVAALNRLRNQLAHGGDREGRDKALDGFLKAAQQDMNDPKLHEAFRQAEPVRQCSLALSSVLGALSSIKMQHEQHGMVLRVMAPAMTYVVATAKSEGNTPTSRDSGTGGATPGLPSS